MRLIRRLGILAAACFAFTTPAVPLGAVVSAGCATGLRGAAGGGMVGVFGSQGCAPIHEPSPSSGSVAKTEPIDCGSHVSVEAVSGGITSPCEQVALWCQGAPTSADGAKTTNIGQFQSGPNGGLTLASAACNVPTTQAAAGVSAAAVEAEIRRRVPGPGVGVAPPGGVSLVNIQTLFWVGTPVDVSLGTVRLVGQLVRLRVQLLRVDWDFGDGARETSTGPGKAYTGADPCRTKLCPDYFGHVYTHHGLWRVGARVSWTGQFQVGAGAWRQIPDTVTGPAQFTTVHIYQAHGELVPDPTDAHPAH